jgi:hypothetical protein
MRFFRRRKLKDIDEMPSVNALAESTEELLRIKARDPEVHRVAQELRSLRKANHFAEQLEAIMGGHR